MKKQLHATSVKSCSVYVYTSDFLMLEIFLHLKRGGNAFQLQKTLFFWEKQAFSDGKIIISMISGLEESIKPYEYWDIYINWLAGFLPSTVSRIVEQKTALPKVQPAYKKKNVRIHYQNPQFLLPRVSMFWVHS